MSELTSLPGFHWQSTVKNPMFDFSNDRHSATSQIPYHNRVDCLDELPTFHGFENLVELFQIQVRLIPQITNPNAFKEETMKMIENTDMKRGF